MNILKFLILFSLIITNFAFAKNNVTKKTSRKPNQLENTAIQFKVVYGEKTTLFVVSKSKNGGVVEFSNNLGAKETKTISFADYDYLKSKVSSLSGPTNQKEFCMRNFIEVKTESREFLGCLGALNKLAVDIQETTNLISILF
jgi:hypothetical protein